jgi:hypothetical protein
VNFTSTSRTAKKKGLMSSVFWPIPQLRTGPSDFQQSAFQRFVEACPGLDFVPCIRDV